MFDQSYQQIYVEKQVIVLEQSYPCPRCKSGNLEPFGETESFLCTGCRRNFVAINFGRVLYPVYNMKTKISPVFWWDGLRWHLAGTTASQKQTLMTVLLFIAPILCMDMLVFYFNHGHAFAQASTQAFWLNLTLFNLLVGFVMAQVFYLTCWDHEARVKEALGKVPKDLYNSFMIENHESRRANSMASGHMPVMLDEAIELLNVRPNRIYVDATAGAGGHLQRICERAGSGKNIIALDQDSIALERLRLRSSGLHGDIQYIHSNFAHLKEVLKNVNINTIDGGILADLGISSNQLEDADRGFSFMRDGPLDMRMDVNNSLSAYNLINDLDESELANIIYLYGEERHSRAIAGAIVRNRPIDTTLTLANIISAVLKRKGSSRKRHANVLHPATRTFQALRIAVNRELDSLKQFLEQAVTLLEPGARLVVITFHSLEDRIVKQFFKRMASNCICPPRLPVCTCGHKAQLLIITPKPLVPSDQEILANIRSRSAKLRAVEKIRSE